MLYCIKIQIRQKNKLTLEKNSLITHSRLWQKLFTTQNHKITEFIMKVFLIQPHRSYVYAITHRLIHPMNYTFLPDKQNCSSSLVHVSPGASRTHQTPASLFTQSEYEAVREQHGWEAGNYYKIWDRFVRKV